MSDNNGHDGLFSLQGDRLGELAPKFRRLTTSKLRPMRSFDTPDGLSFGLQSFGHGPPIVFLANGLFNRETLGQLPKQLADLGRTTVIELRGLNQDTRLVEALSDYRIGALADAFETAVNSVAATEELVVVSQGSNVLVAAEWARRHQDRARGMCFIDGVTAPVSAEHLTSVWSTAIDGLGRQDSIDVTLDSSSLKAIAGLLAGEAGSVAADRIVARPSSDRSDIPRLASIANIPVESAAAATVSHAQEIDAWLRTVAIPKLFIDSQPFVFGHKAAERSYPQQTAVRVNGPGLRLSLRPDRPSSSFACGCTSCQGSCLGRAGYAVTARSACGRSATTDSTYS